LFLYVLVPFLSVLIIPKCGKSKLQSSLVNFWAHNTTSQNDISQQLQILHKVFKGEFNPKKIIASNEYLRLIK